MSVDKINMEVSIERSKDHVCTGFVLYCKDTERSIASFWNESDAEKAEDAINSYDDNQALIAKQAGHINIMRHALTEIKNTPSVRHDECSWIASVALEATKEQA